MSASADQELIAAAVSALRDDPELHELVAGRIYDRVPEKNVTLPYVALGPVSAVPDDFDCRAGEQITIQFDVYSAGSGPAYTGAECRQISDRIKRVLHNADLALQSNALISLELELKNVFRDPDGVTNHGVVQFTATVETP